MDFQFDATAYGRRLKFFSVIDEHSRLCLAIRVVRCKSKDILSVLEELTCLYPAPAFIRIDNGPEFIAHALNRWSDNSGNTTAYIEPGSSWLNDSAESFNSRFKDEFLENTLFATVAEAQALANRWRWEYNNLTPYSALQGRTPLEAVQPAAVLPSILIAPGPMKGGTLVRCSAGTPPLSSRGFWSAFERTTML